MRKLLILVAAAALLGLVALAQADQPPLVTTQHSMQVKGAGDAASTASDASNLLALHDPDSSAYDGACLSCHASVLTEETKDPRIPSFHQAMMPFTPGYNPAHGPSDEVCVQCHRFVDLKADSAGALRKQVDPALCALCHGPSGPGPVFYAR